MMNKWVDGRTDGWMEHDSVTTSAMSCAATLRETTAALVKSTDKMKLNEINEIDKKVTNKLKMK